MNHPEPESSPHLLKSLEFSLSGPSLLELLREVLVRGSRLRFRTKGFSMSPFIKDGDIVTISPHFGRAPFLGDIVAAVHPETRSLVLHRVLGKKEGGYLIKGDNAPRPDGIVKETDILGRVAVVERKGKKAAAGIGKAGILIALLSRGGLLTALRSLLARLLRNREMRNP